MLFTTNQGDSWSPLKKKLLIHLFGIRHILNHVQASLRNEQFYNRTLLLFMIAKETILRGTFKTGMNKCEANITLTVLDYTYATDEIVKLSQRHSSYTEQCAIIIK